MFHYIPLRKLHIFRERTYYIVHMYHIKNMQIQSSFLYPHKLKFCYLDILIFDTYISVLRPTWCLPTRMRAMLSFSDTILTAQFYKNLVILLIYSALPFLFSLESHTIISFILLLTLLKRFHYASMGNYVARADNF